MRTASTVRIKRKRRGTSGPRFNNKNSFSLELALIRQLMPETTVHQQKQVCLRLLQLAQQA